MDKHKVFLYQPIKRNHNFRRTIINKSIHHTDPGLSPEVVEYHCGFSLYFYNLMYYKISVFLLILSNLLGYLRHCYMPFVVY